MLILLVVGREVSISPLTSGESDSTCRGTEVSVSLTVGNADSTCR
ncbi:MAG: hypothetical protein U7123_27830 [Potamolinea sp.]